MNQSVDCGKRCAITERRRGMQQTDFTKGPITKSLLSFFFSMLLANILQQFYSFADMVIIGKGLGDEAVAAVGNFTTFSFLITGFIMGVTNGFSVMISQTYGEKDFAALRKAAALTVKLSVLMAAVLTGIGLWILYPVLQMMKTDQMLVTDCLTYGRVIFGGLLITVFYNLFSAILRAVGDGKTPLLAIGVSSCINLGLDFLFLFWFDTGVAGPAWATIAAQLVSVGICCCRLYQIREFRLSRSDFAFDGKMERELLRNGVPMAFMNSITSVGCIFVQGCVNGYGVICQTAGGIDAYRAGGNWLYGCFPEIFSVVSCPAQSAVCVQKLFAGNGKAGHPHVFRHCGNGGPHMCHFSGPACGWLCSSRLCGRDGVAWRAVY